MPLIEDLDAWFARTMPPERCNSTPPRDQNPPQRPISHIEANPFFPKIALRDPWLLWGIASLLLINVLWLLFFQRQPQQVDRERFAQVQQILTDVRKKRSEKLTQIEWDEFSSNLSDHAAKLLQQMDGEPVDPARQCMQWALRYRLPNILKYGRFHASYQEIAFEHLLEEAKRHLHPSR